MKHRRNGLLTAIDQEISTFTVFSDIANLLELPILIVPSSIGNAKRSHTCPTDTRTIAEEVKYIITGIFQYLYPLLMKFLTSFLISLSLSVSACTNVTVQAPQTPQPSQTPQAASTPKDPPPTNLPTETTPSAPNKFPQASNQTNESCNYAAGKAVGGQEISVDLCSIRVNNPQSVSFTYYLNSDRVESEADCSNGTWVTFPERQVNRPQSPATQNMLDTVCSRRDSTSSATSSAGTAIVFDPPSNVRVSPNGAILCSVQKKTTINIYGSDGSWYKTDVCGSVGFIHANQVRF